jgi:hypothetical protein
MGTAVDHMSNLNMNSNSDSTTLSVPKLRDDRRNWADYQPRIERALGSKGLWRHVLGAAIVPKPYILLAGVPVIADGKTPAMEGNYRQLVWEILRWSCQMGQELPK